MTAVCGGSRLHPATVIVLITGDRIDCSTTPRLAGRAFARRTRADPIPDKRSDLGITAAQRVMYVGAPTYAQRQHILSLLMDGRQRRYPPSPQ